MEIPKANIIIMFKLLDFRSINNFFTSFPSPSPLLAGSDQTLLCKSLIPFNFLPFKLYMFCHTQISVLKNIQLAKKNDTQQKHGGKEMFPHFLPKPYLKNKNSRIYFMSNSRN